MMDESCASCRYLIRLEYDIQGFLERHCSLLPEVNMKSYNTIKSHLGGIWENGFANGEKDAYTRYDKDWKHRNNLIEELKQQEYQHGLDAAKLTLEVDTNIAYQSGLHDLWYAIRQLELSPADGALSVDEIEKIFGTSSVYSILQNVHPESVIDKIRAYEEQRKADEIVFTNADKLKEVFGKNAEDLISWDRTSWLNEPYKEHDNGN